MHCIYFSLQSLQERATGVRVSLSEEGRIELRERVRRAVNNITELRRLLLELKNTDPDFAQMFEGPEVSLLHSYRVCTDILGTNGEPASV